MMAEILALVGIIIILLAILCFVLAFIVRNGTVADICGYIGTSLVVIFILGLILVIVLCLLDRVLKIV